MNFYLTGSEPDGWQFSPDVPGRYSHYLLPGSVPYFLDSPSGAALLQEMTGMDTINFPNFGFEPEPVIKKGNNDLECLVGFLDKEKKFRDYLKVFVDGDRLRVKTLKQYSVYQK